MDNFNVRRDFDLNELKEQIKAKGVLNPITVIPFKDENGKELYKLVDGERRYRATMEAIGEGANIPWIKAPRKRLARMEKVVQKYDAEQTGWTISLGSLYKGRTIFPTAYYGAGKEADFAGRRWLLPDKCEEMLSSLYGDYMTPPPPDKRVGHNLKPRRLRCRSRLRPTQSLCGALRLTSSMRNFWARPIPRPAQLSWQKTFPS